MQVYKIDPLRDDRWVELIHNHPQASVFHTREWLYSIHQTYGYKPVVVTTSPPSGELKNGLVFCRIRSWLTGNRMVSLPFSDHCEPLVDSAEELELLVHCLQSDMQCRDWGYLEFRPLNGRFERNARHAGFCPANLYLLHRLDLRPSLDEIFQSLHKDSAQRRIQRAEKAGIECRNGRSKKMLRDFYKLLVLTRRRHHLPPQPYVWFRNLLDCMGESLEIRLAYRGVLPIAAILTLRFRNTTYYKYGCSDARFHSLGAMPALLWNTVQASKATGSKELDLGRSECQNKGLIAFKDHWAQKHSTVVYWRYPKSGRILLTEGWKLRMAKRAFACLPTKVLPIMGRLFYRHAG
jgi:Acetyltransferase (GNAT) domain